MSRLTSTLKNAVPRLVLASPIHRLMSARYATLHFTGRTTGRSSHVPVAYRERHAGARRLHRFGVVAQHRRRPTTRDHARRTSVSVLYLVTVCVVGFVGCAEFGSWALVHPVLRRLPPQYWLEVEQGLLGTFGRVMPIGMTAAPILAGSTAVSLEDSARTLGLDGDRSARCRAGHHDRGQRRNQQQDRPMGPERPTPRLATTTTPLGDVSRHQSQPAARRLRCGHRRRGDPMTGQRSYYASGSA